MKFIVNIEMPVEPFNTMARDGTVGQVLEEILEDIDPEVAYFYAPGGCRGCMLVVDMEDASAIPSIAEPFFLKFGARFEIHVAMSPADLARGGLASLGEKWG